jgi:tRNA pseudouridine55 synthase
VIDGLLVVDKPAGWTSHDVVAKLRAATRQRRIGHAGTLDPDATGVLLVGLGRATRLMRYLQETTKEYRGVVSFGVATSTLDAAGEELARVEMPVTEADVRAAMTAFVGDIEQVPPMVSALKVDGRRLHELAREGKEVERAPRPVRITRYDLETFAPGDFPQATVFVECSSGTYVRTLAADLGAALGGHAHLASLRRLRVGAFTLAEATELDRLLTDPIPFVHSPADALRGMERIVVDAEVAALVATGRVFDDPPFAVEGPGPFALVDDRARLLAVYERRDTGLKPSVVIPVDAPSEGGGD